MAATLNSSGVVFSDSTFMYSTSFNALGSFAMVAMYASTGPAITATNGSNYSAGAGKGQIRSASLMVVGQYSNASYVNNLSGTWRWLGGTHSNQNIGCCYFPSLQGIAVRVA